MTEVDIAGYQKDGISEKAALFFTWCLWWPWVSVAPASMGQRKAGGTGEGLREEWWRRGCAIARVVRPDKDVLIRKMHLPIFLIAF